MVLAVGMVSLGCAKNLVDSEVMLGFLENRGFRITNRPDEAEVLIVNTCGFIESAKKESIDAILEMARFKEEGSCRMLVVAGCMAEKYRRELLSEMPEIDALIGPGEVSSIVPLVERLIEDRQDSVLAMTEAGEGFKSYIYDAKTPRKIATPSYMAYVKIADGCDNRCSYCQIPSMRGGYRSRDPRDVQEEVLSLARRGVRELIFIAQDTTAYGQDLPTYADLAGLLQSLEDIEGPSWYRLLYTYPTRITDKLINIINASQKICRYLDIPLQHADDGMLRAMNRCGDEEFYRELIAKLRLQIPGIALRSSFIVGFPGETEDRFNRLLNFVRDMKLDHIGVFTYSREEGTPAAAMDGQIPAREKKRRQNALMKLQLGIVREKNGGKIGKTFNVLVEGNMTKDCEVIYFGRTEGDASEIDGRVFFTGGQHVPGDIVPVKINGFKDYDLTGVYSY